MCRGCVRCISTLKQAHNPIKHTTQLITAQQHSTAQLTEKHSIECAQQRIQGYTAQHSIAQPQPQDSTSHHSTAQHSTAQASSSTMEEKEEGEGGCCLLKNTHATIMAPLFGPIQCRLALTMGGRGGGGGQCTQCVCVEQHTQHSQQTQHKQYSSTAARQQTAHSTQHAANSNTVHSTHYTAGSI